MRCQNINTMTTLTNGIKDRVIFNHRYTLHAQVTSIYNYSMLVYAIQYIYVLVHYFVRKILIFNF